MADQIHLVDKQTYKLQTMQTALDLTQRNGKTATIEPQIKFEQQLITPAKAKYWLENRAANRTVDRRDKRVEQYVKDMQNGKWRLGDPLKFDADGRLIDGQHRLMAIVKADIAVEFTILSGYPVESMIVLDTGKPRTVHQSLTISGASCTKAHIAILNAMFTNPSTLTRPRTIDRQLLAALYERHSEAVQFAARTYTAALLACKYAPIRALVKFLWILDGRPTEEKRDKAPFLLRNQYIMHRKNRSAGVMLYNKTLVALKAFSEHRSPDVLREAKIQFYPVADFD